MEVLIELLDLLDEIRVDKIEVIGNPNQYTGKMKLLHDGIKKGEIKNDQDAIESLYGNLELGNRTYEKLKYRLQDRLINTLFFVDLNKAKYTDHQRAYFYCQKSFAAINILLGKGGRRTAILLAERTLSVAIQFEHTEIALNLLKRLTRHYGNIERDKKKFETYSKLTDIYLEINNAETLAQQLQARLTWLHKETAANQLKTESIAIDFCEQLEKYIKKVKTDTFLRFAYYVFVTRFDLVGDYKNGLKMCEKVLKELEKKKNINNGSIAVFNSRKIIFQIQLKKYNHAEKDILKTLEKLPKGTVTWFNLYGNLLKIFFLQKKYNEAYNTYYKIINDVKIKSIYRDIKEEWNLYEAYISFFIKIRKIDISKGIYHPKKKFRINKFLNEVPSYSKDKQGLNIPILIIQLLFLLQQRKYGKVIDRTEALNTYCYRYLKRDDNFRSHCFIKLLILLTKCNFNKLAVKRKANNLYSKLISMPIESVKQSASIEFIPYEDLWEVVLNMLDNKFHKARK